MQNTPVPTCMLYTEKETKKKKKKKRQKQKKNRQHKTAHHIENERQSDKVRSDFLHIIIAD